MVACSKLGAKQKGTSGPHKESRYHPTMHRDELHVQLVRKKTRARKRSGHGGVCEPLHTRTRPMGLRHWMAYATRCMDAFATHASHRSESSEENKAVCTSHHDASACIQLLHWSHRMTQPLDASFNVVDSSEVLPLLVRSTQFTQPSTD